MVHNLTGGGAERVAVLWATGFAERGDEVIVVILESTKIAYDISKKAEIICLKPLVKNKLLSRILYRTGISRHHYLHSLSEIIHERKPDVCIGVMGPYARDAYRLSRDIGTRIIQTYHSSFDLPETAPINRRKDVEKCYSLDNCVETRTVLTQADKDYIGNRMKNVFVMPNPLAFNVVKEIPQKQKIILACGRLDVWEVKGFDVLIEAWGKVAQKHPDWSLHLAGTGSKNSEDYLKMLAVENRVADKMEFLGFREDVISLYKSSEIFVLSSRYEGFGMVLIEAMSQGCACIACDYKGRQKEIIENENQGLLCPPENVDALARALDRMITDVSYRKICQNNALDRASYFTVKETIKRWDYIFEQTGIKRNK